jgi:phosphoribosyl 1,2-cyclic phosphodiesterase
MRYGGNTSCVEVRLDDGTLIIFDAGTGIRALGQALLAQAGPVRAHLFLSHAHWDHIQGIPFFYPSLYCWHGTDHSRSRTWTTDPGKDRHGPDAESIFSYSYACHGCKD